MFEQNPVKHKRNSGCVYFQPEFLFVFTIKQHIPKLKGIFRKSNKKYAIIEMENSLTDETGGNKRIYNFRKNEVRAVENNQMLPFERNRYYMGKLLTTPDFQAEQAYGIQKRRFMNGMLYGDGIICGLGVYSLDDQSIMLDSGVALDGLGREIAVDASLVRKLSAIKGFEELTGSTALLCLRYNEEQVHPVYSVHSQDGDDRYECNRIREGWELFLQDADSCPISLEAECEFLNTVQLFDDDDFTISLSAPASASCGRRIRLDVIIEFKHEATQPLSLSMLLQTPAFTGENGEHSLSVDLNEITAPVGTAFTRSYWLTAQELPAADSAFMISADSVKILAGTLQKPLSENFMMRVAVEDLTPDQIISRSIGRISLESRDISGYMEYVPLAKIKLQRTKSAYIIESVIEDGIKRYVHTNASIELRQKMNTYFADSAAAAFVSAGEKANTEQQSERGGDIQYATGICEIPIAKCRRGEIVYSDDIIHGLGAGNVIVQIGLEYISENSQFGGQSRKTIFGDASLFNDGEAPITDSKTAIRVNNDRGSFTVAVQLNEDANQVVMVLRWMAIRMPAGKESLKLQRMTGKSIAAERPTVVLATRESFFFNVRFKNMEPCTLTYELTEKDSGEITSDGIYTAPGKEGVYEIRISCADMPLISTYAYAVVKKRTGMEEETAD